MSLVATIENETDYDFKENLLDKRIVETIERGDYMYKDLWYSWCDRRKKNQPSIHVLYDCVLAELCREASDDLNSVKYDYSSYYIASLAGIFIGIGCCFPSLILGGAGLIWTASNHIFIQTLAPKYIRAWKEYPREHIIDSINNIREKAPGVICQYIKSTY